MPCWPRLKEHGLEVIKTDRLDLTDLLEVSDLLLRGQTFRFRVAGWSMYPALGKGDQLTVEAASPEQLQVGDLLLFHDHGRLVCHRLVAMQKTGTEPRLITKGDAATGCDAPLQPEQVLGRVVGVRPRWRWAGHLSMQIDCRLTRLRAGLARTLLALQGLRAYRRMVQVMFSRRCVYYVGIPEGKRWFRYHRIGSSSIPKVLKGHQSLHLVAKLAGIGVGSLRITASGEEYWIDNLYVRIRFRGLGVGSQLLALAATAATRSGARVLLASVEPANTAALHLFTKMGFRTTGGLPGTQVSLRQDLEGCRLQTWDGRGTSTARISGDV
jgi:ribosomal protein S18 acetylase RimI-like enzyme